MIIMLSVKKPIPFNMFQVCKPDLLAKQQIEAQV